MESSNLWDLTPNICRLKDMSVTIVIRKLLIAKDMHVKSPKMFLGKKIRKSLKTRGGTNVS